MKRVFALFAVGILLSAMILSGCGLTAVPESVYSDEKMWYDDGRQTDPSLADVFYLLPSCVYDWEDSTGTVHHNASLEDSLQMVRMNRAFPVAVDIFGDSANFFSPYYRQITLNSWQMDEDTRNVYLNIALDDVRDAFSYYLEHLNGGRPFVLAGFSQGARCALQLLQEMRPDVVERMVAAYIIGYPVSRELMDGCEWIRPAAGAEDCGVCIAYSTVSDVRAMTPLVNGGNAVVINPASWTTDNLPHPVNDTVMVRIDRDNNVLVAEGIDASLYVKPKLAGMIPEGNLHLAELDLYSDQLRENVRMRIREATELILMR